MFTDGDQSALEEECPFMDIKRVDGAANDSNEQPQSIEADACDILCDRMSDLAMPSAENLSNPEQCDDHEEVQVSFAIEDEDNNEQLHQNAQDVQTPGKKQTPRKRSRRKKNNNAADLDPHEDEGDSPLNISSQDLQCINTEQEPTPSKANKDPCPQRTLEEELAFLTRVSPTKYIVKPGFVPNMKVSAEIIVNDDLENLLIQELRDTCCDTNSGGDSSFIPALRQAANVAALPGIVKASLAMPDVHSGYGFCIGNVAAFDMDDPEAVISPGGVGFDINCGVRLIRTNLTEKDVGEEVREQLADALYRNIPVGVGVDGNIPCERDDLDILLENGIDWAIENGYAWEEDKAHCEEYGRMETADPKCVSNRAKKRGLKQLGTLGAGNHYAEVQIVDEIYNPDAAKAMGIDTLGQVCIMIHTGSRGLGHQVATDALTEMENAMARDQIELNDRQLSCARISSREGRKYLGELNGFVYFACNSSEVCSHFYHPHSCHVCCCQLCLGKSFVYYISCT
jgi:hypothetical protein